MDNGGKLTACTDPDTVKDSGDNMSACTSLVIDGAIRNIIADTLEFGCQRYDKIEFSSPKETLVRCTPGWKATWQWDRPTECNLCEDIGFTVKYGCGYELLAENAEHLVGFTNMVPNWKACSELCEMNGECRAWNFDNSAAAGGPSTGECKLYSNVSDSTEKKCGVPTVENSVSGQLCVDAKVCDARICEDCDATGYSKAAACTYSDDFNLGFTFENILTYSDCLSKCDHTPGCLGVTYFTKFMTANEANSPMSCVLKGHSQSSKNLY